MKKYLKNVKICPFEKRYIFEAYRNPMFQKRYENFKVKF